MTVIRQPGQLGPTEEYELMLQEICLVMEEGLNNVRAEGIRVKYLICKIIGTSAIYQRGAWGSGKVIGTLATDLRTNTRDVYDCIQFYFKCVDFDRSKLVEHVDHQHWVASLKGKPDALSWSWIRGKLPEGRAAPRRKVRRRTYTRQVQGYCNRRIGKEWTKANQQKIEHYLGYADDPDSIDPDAAVERGDKDEWT